MTKDKKNQEDVRGAVEDALLKALESETFIEGLSRKVAEKLLQQGAATLIQQSRQPPR